eukprot:Clim_evm8s147 gene=Clim_evmTU8s147
MWPLESLVKLQLDNNVIERIEGIETLLKDLVLHEKKMRTIEGLDSQTESLQVLTIGKNLITKMADLLYLRQFKKLKSLSLEGNPICEDTRNGRKDYAIAHIPQLVYLDHRIIHDGDRKQAYNLHSASIVEIETKEMDDSIQSAKLKKAHVSGLQIEAALANLYECDVDAAKLKYIAGYDDAVSQQRAAMECVCEQATAFALIQ